MDASASPDRQQLLDARVQAHQSRKVSKYTEFCSISSDRKDSSEYSGTMKMMRTMKRYTHTTTLLATDYVPRLVNNAYRLNNHKN